MQIAQGDADDSLFKTVLCMKFNTPTGCRFADNCKFAHGQAELRPRPAADQPQQPQQQPQQQQRETGTVVYVDPTSGIQGQIRPDSGLGCDEHMRTRAYTRASARASRVHTPQHTHTHTRSMHIRGAACTHARARAEQGQVPHLVLLHARTHIGVCVHTSCYTTHTHANTHTRVRACRCTDCERYYHGGCPAHPQRWFHQGFACIEPIPPAGSRVEYEPAVNLKNDKPIARNLVLLAAWHDVSLILSEEDEPRRTSSSDARIAIRKTFVEMFTTSSNLWDAYKGHIQETQRQLKVFSPVDGWACTFDPGLGQDMSTHTSFPLRWYNRSEDCVTGGFDGANFLIMRMSLVAVCAETEYFCQHALKCVKDKLAGIYKDGCDWRASAFDWEKMIKAAARCESGENDAKVIAELAAMHFDRNKAFENLNKSIERELNQCGINPTLFRGVFRVAAEAFKLRDNTTERPHSQKLRSYADVHLKRLSLDIVETKIVTAQRSMCEQTVHKVLISSSYALDKISRLYYGLRCIIAHGDAKDTLHATLDDGNLTFFKEDFKSCLKCAHCTRDAPAPEAFAQLPETWVCPGPGCGAPKSAYQNAEAAAAYFNGMMGRLGDAARNPRLEIRMMYDDFLIYSNFAKILGRVVAFTLASTFHPDEMKDLEGTGDVDEPLCCIDDL
jgi:hypothetical protein